MSEIIESRIEDVNFLIKEKEEQGVEITRQVQLECAAKALNLDPKSDLDLPAVSVLTDQVISASSRNLDGLEVDVELSDKNMAVHSQADERESLNEGFGLADD